MKPLLDGLKPVWDLRKHGLTQGSVGTFLTCPEKFRLGLKYGMKVRGGDWSSALQFGSIFHDVMAVTVEKVAKFKKDLKNPDVMIDVMHDVMKEYHARAHDELNETSMMAASDQVSLQKDVAEATVMLEAYFRTWSRDFAELEWVALEKEFNIESPPFSVPLTMSENHDITFPLRGKMDGVFRYKGQLWLFETKTKSRITDDSVLQRLPYEFQVMLYMHAIEQIYGERPAGVLYNLIRKPQLRQKTSESHPEFCTRIAADVIMRPDDYFSRYQAEITSEEMERFWQEFYSLLSTIVDWDLDRFHFRNSNSCVNTWGRACEYQQVCANGDWSFLYQRKTVYQELEMHDVNQGSTGPRLFTNTMAQGEAATNSSS